MAYPVARVLTSIAEIPRKEWEAVWPAETEGYDFYLNQESAGIEDFEFGYLVVYVDDLLVALMPLFTADFNIGLALGQRGRRNLDVAQRVWPRFLVFRTLFCGSPVSEKLVFGRHPAHANDPLVVKALDEALLGFAKAQRAFMLVCKDVMDCDLPRLHGLESRGWFIGDSVPTAALPISFETIDGYFAQLGYGTRKNLRRKMRQTANSGTLEIEVVGDVGHCLADVCRLYLDVRTRGELQWERLNAAFFKGIAAHMPDNVVYFLYWSRPTADAPRRLIAFNLCVYFEDRLIDKYIGMDYEVARELNLYYISFLNNVQWCLDNRKRTYMLSQGGYAVKSQLGAQLIPLRTLTKLRNPILNWVAKVFSPRGRQ